MTRAQAEQLVREYDVLYAHANVLGKKQVVELRRLRNTFAAQLKGS